MITLNEKDHVIIQPDDAVNVIIQLADNINVIAQPVNNTNIIIKQDNKPMKKAILLSSQMITSMLSTR
jgi:hypothetical protein